MNKDEYLLFNKDLYEKELDNRDRILSRSNISIVILTSYTGAITYIIQRLNLESVLSINTLSTLFWIFVVLTAVPYLLALWYLISVYGGIRGHSYHMLPTATIIDGYKNTLDEMYTEYDGMANEYFYKYLLMEYQKCASENAVKNDERGKKLQRCTALSFVALIPLAFLFLIFSFSSFNTDRNDKKTTIYHVDINSKSLTPRVSCDTRIQLRSATLAYAA
ncbi:hypothetical protein [Aeromonas caviae]|uniref:hypothetical protein n=1 Tax=Aeromonas caviae TaxID=648 RepID=UPI00388E4EB5